MTPTDLRIAMRHLRLDEPSLARLLGVRPLTVAKYLEGRLGISKPMARLLWACDRDPSLQAALLGGRRGCGSLADWPV